MRNYTLTLACWGLFLAGSFAQLPELTPPFAEKLADTGLSLVEPLDAGYRSVPVEQNDFQRYDFAIRSSDEDMEIRYYVLPYSEQDTLSMSPDVLCLRASASVATNDEESVISMLPVARSDLQKSFGADWGIIYFFQPKSDFAPYAHCRMLALHKEQTGTALVFFLFNDPNNEAVDRRFEALRFDPI